MEEQIRWIIEKNIQDSADGVAFNVNLSAKEITEYVMGFIEWVGDSGYEYHSKHKVWVADYRRTTEELYQYWLTQIKTNK